MQNIDDLLKDLIADRKKAQEKKMDVATFNAFNNNAGKIIKVCLVQIKERERLGDLTPIDFLKTA